MREIHRLLFLLCAVLVSLESVDSFLPVEPGSVWNIEARSSTQLDLWHSSVSKKVDGVDAIQELVDEANILRNHTQHQQQAVAFLFVSAFHTYKFSEIVERAYQGLGEQVLLLSLIGGGVIGDNEEHDESAPVISMLWGILPPSAKATGFFDGAKQSWTSVFRSGRSESSRVVFADPWFDIEDSIMANKGRNDIVIGGISCPSVFADEIRPTVAINGTALPKGSAAGVSFSGSFGIQAIVAQGCRPIGPIFNITSADGNILKELDGVPSLTQLEKVASEASVKDKLLMERNGLLCGIASRDPTTKAPTDFLIRQIMGLLDLAQNSTGKGGGSLSLGLKTVREGDQFQFQVRDGTVAKDDMEAMMKRAKVERLFVGANAGTPVAALQISCAARGRSLFGQPNVDFNVIEQQLLGGGLNVGTSNETDVPVGGFFANGEIGPIGISGMGSSSVGSTHIHTFTTIVGLLCDYSESYDSSSSQASESSIEISSEEDWG